MNATKKLKTNNNNVYRKINIYFIMKELRLHLSILKLKFILFFRSRKLFLHHKLRILIFI